MKKEKKRCNELGCVHFKFEDDERCLMHIRQKYHSVWYKSMPQDHGKRKMTFTLDSIESVQV